MSDMSPEHCPGCERFIGTEDVCPYCDNDSIQRQSRRLVRRGSQALIIACLSGIWLCRAPILSPALSVAAAQWSPGGREVRVAGRVSHAPFLAAQGGYATFILVDGPYRLRAALEGTAAQELVASGRCPVSGQVVQVSGSLRGNGAEGLRLCVPRADAVSAPATLDPARPVSTAPPCPPPAFWRILQPHLYWLFPGLAIALIASPMRVDTYPGLNAQSRIRRWLRRRTCGLLIGAAIVALVHGLGTAPAWPVALMGAMTVAGLTVFGSIEKTRKRDVTAGLLMVGLELTTALLHTL